MESKLGTKYNAMKKEFVRLNYPIFKRKYKDNINNSYNELLNDSAKYISKLISNKSAGLLLYLLSHELKYADIKRTGKFNIIPKEYVHISNIISELIYNIGYTSNVKYTLDELRKCVNYSNCINVLRETVNINSILVKADIENYYGNITRYKCLNNHTLIISKNMKHLYMISMTSMEKFDLDLTLFKTTIINNLISDNGLVAGFPHSSYIAMDMSLYLAESILSNFIINKVGVNDTLIFYIDDILFITENHEMADNYMKAVINVLNINDFKLNNSKTNIYDLSKDAPVCLGVRIVADKKVKIILPKYKSRKLKKDLTYQQLAGWVGHLNTIYPNGDIRIITLMEKMSNKQYNSDIDLLSLLEEKKKEYIC